MKARTCSPLVCFPVSPYSQYSGACRLPLLKRPSLLQLPDALSGIWVETHIPWLHTIRVAGSWARPQQRREVLWQLNCLWCKQLVAAVWPGACGWMVKVCCHFKLSDTTSFDSSAGHPRPLSPPSADDVLTPSKGLPHLTTPQVPAEALHGPRLSVCVFPPVWGFRWWRWWRKRRGRPQRPRGEPVRQSALFFTLLCPAGGEAAVSCVEAEAESAGAPGEPQHGAAQCTQWGGKEHPGNQEPTGQENKSHVNLLYSRLKWVWLAWSWTCSKHVGPFSSVCVIANK